MRNRNSTEIVAIVLAIGISVSIFALVIGVMWSAIKHGNSAATITENETQVLLATFSGIFGILGAHVGYKMGKQDGENGNGGYAELPPDERDTAPHPTIPPGHGWPTPPAD